MDSALDQRTGNVLVEDVIFLDHIIDNLLGALVNHKHFPLVSTRHVLAGAPSLFSVRGWDRTRVGVAHVACCNVPNRLNDDCNQGSILSHEPEHRKVSLSCCSWIAEIGILSAGQPSCTSIQGVAESMMSSNREPSPPRFGGLVATKEKLAEARRRKAAENDLRD